MPHFIDELDGGSTDATQSSPTELKIKQVGDFAPTEEQEAIVRAVIDTKENIMIDALAGAAKTSSLVLIANQPKMLSVATLTLAFNKKIADEMKARLPASCVSMTLNSLGHRTWSKAIGKRCKPSTRKNYGIFSELVGKERNDIQEELFERTSDLLKTIAFAKTSGWIPEDCQRKGNSLWDSDDEFFDHLEEEPTPIEREIITKVVLHSIEASYEGDIDFDDQIFMPTCFPAQFPNYPLTMIDEAQDLSSLNHFMLAQIVKEKRLIAVGDPCQAIYGFRGAHQDSMELLQKQFNMKVMHLTTSFRCPKAIVESARWRAPAMNAPSWAKEGKVELFKGPWSVDDLPSTAVVICRNNAPIFSMAIKFLIDDRFPNIIGRDIGKSITKALTKLGGKDMLTEQVYEAIDLLEMQRLSRARPHAKGAIKDFCECLRIFCRHGDNLGDIIAYADHLINMEGQIKMMTIHKSKGLEFDHVYLLEPDLLDTRNKGSQDRNLKYVAQTRAMETLTFVNIGEFTPINSAGEEEA